MRRMMSQKQIDYVNDLSKTAIFLNNNKNITIKNGSVNIAAGPENSNTASVSLGTGSAYLSADNECAISGYYSEDGGDYLYNLEIGENGIELQILDEYSSGDYISRLIVNKTGILFPSLPELDPKVEGALWNDNGVLKISAGI